MEMQTGERMQRMTQAFLESEVRGRGLDERTERAYRQDLTLFGNWLTERGAQDISTEDANIYLRHLLRDRKLRYSTVSRKYRVLRYFFIYLQHSGQGNSGLRADVPLRLSRKEPGLPLAGEEDVTLTRAEVDALFAALTNCYQEQDSDFRRRVCLRDSVMLELLFYHDIEVSELLKLRKTDYDRKTGLLTIRGKRGKLRAVKVYARDLRQKLEQLLDEHDCFEHDPDNDSWMFLSKYGRPLSMWMLIKIFNKYKEQAGIDKPTTPKDLKRSMQRYAQELLEEQTG